MTDTKETQPIAQAPNSEESSAWNFRESLAHFGRGILMGAADIVPGVSGGTVALVVGIYSRLVEAVSRVDSHLLGLLKNGDVRSIAKYLDLRLLIPLGMGIGIGIVALGSVMHTLLEDYTTFTLAAFFGLIAASSIFVARLVPRRSVDTVSALFVGIVVAYWVVGLPGLKNPPDSLWYLFLCGAIGICAMILPGVSGAFLLLILGVYSDITGVIKGAVKGDLSVDAITQIAVFGAGVVVGILCFSKVLKKLLTVAPSVTLALLCGLMLGSLRKLWPFQRELTAGQDLKFKERVFEVIPLSELPLDANFFIAIGLAIAGACAVFLLGFLAGSRNVDPLSHQANEPA